MNRSITLLIALLTGCGGYANRSQAFRHALDSGAPESALERVNRELGVAEANALPFDANEETPLLLLERATILQAMGRYALSARDFQRADKALDILDLTGDTAGEISRYLFSDDDTLYKSPPHEKLLLNTLNMVNYLVQGNAGGAKVEARRFQINRRYLEDQEGDDGRSFLAVGSFLAGAAFEMAGEWEIAMRHYADAYVTGGIPTLKTTIRRLARTRGARDTRVAELTDAKPPPSLGPTTNEGPVLASTGEANPTVAVQGSATATPSPMVVARPKIAAATGVVPASAKRSSPAATDEAAPGPEAKPASPPTAPSTASAKQLPSAGGTLLVVTQTGMAPHKVPRRVPLANAIVIASHPGRGARLSAVQRRRANRLAAEGLVKWVNFPDLEPAHDAHGPVSVEVDGAPIPGGLGLNVSLRVTQQFARARGSILAAAITRLVTRAVVGSVARNVADGRKGNSLAGLLVGLAVEGAMSAADTPDTRSWVTLPARIHVARTTLPEGRHQVGVRFRGRMRTRTIDIKRGGFVVLNFSDLR